MAGKSLNMIEKMMDRNIIDYYIINCALPLIITIDNRYQIDFDKPGNSSDIVIFYDEKKLDETLQILLCKQTKDSNC